MLQALYALCTRLAQPLLRRKLARRGRTEPGYLEAVEERFGHYSQPADSGLVWVHAVSLGETRAAAILVQAMRQRWPHLRLLLTHGTATGRAEGQRLLRPGDVQVWQPWDTPEACTRFLAHFKPRVGLLMETEVWPSLVAACQQQHMPLVLANARLSDKSLRAAQRLGWLAGPAYRGLSTVYAQTQDDARRLATLGAPVAGVFGNLKFDVTPDPDLLWRGKRWREQRAAPVVLLASAREGEEIAFLEQIVPLVQAWRASRAMENEAIPVQWLIVPRHPQRFDEVAERVHQSGLRLQRRSAWGDSGPADAAPADVWLGDSLGEMPLYYGLADVALLGGSFAPLGGQNLIEAAACGCPVVMGPHTFNFAEAALGSEAAGAGLRVAGMAEGVALAVQLAQEDTTRLRGLQQASLGFVAAHRGASARTLDALAAPGAPLADWPSTSA